MREWLLRKVWDAFVISKCPNVTLFERILGQITKICFKHPEEVLIRRRMDKEEPVWVQLFETLYALRNNEYLSRKPYCRQYIRLQNVKFARGLLTHVTLEDIIDTILKTAPKLRWRGIREIVVDSFQVKRCLISLTNSAGCIVNQEATEM